MLTRILTSLCERIDVDEVKRENCKGLSILPFTSFYPLPYFEIRHLNDHKRKRKILQKLKNSYGMHLWNSITKKTIFDLKDDNAIVELMETHCPAIYNEYLD